MADHHAHSLFPAHLDIRHPGFSRQSLLWASHMQLELAVLVANTRKTLTQSQALMAEVDRLLARR